MLKNAPIRAYIPASDIPRARKFYEEFIGLQPKAEYAGGVVYQCGGAEVFMYPTPNAGTSKASQAFWQVNDVENRMVQRHRGEYPRDRGTAITCVEVFGRSGLSKIPAGSTLSTNPDSKQVGAGLNFRHFPVFQKS